MIPASVVIITKNEDKNIADALESVKDFEDIVVVDSFSEDRTVEICKKYTDRVYQHEWQGYAKQKQMAVDYAKKPWVLILDADERVTPELKTEIMENIRNSTKLTPDSELKTLSPQSLSGDPNSYCGFYLPRKNFFLGRWIKHSGWWYDYTLRLFKKDVSLLEQREVHERVVVKGKTGYLDSPVEHYTYRTISDYIKKMENYSSLSAKELSNKKIPGKKIPYLFKMFVSPLFIFFKMFFFRQGFRDGIHGFILAVFYSFYTFLKYAKAWEENKKSG